MQSVKDITAQVMPTADLLELLNPINPQRLQHIGDGIYEAVWTPEAIAAEEYSSDLEILGITTAVQLIGPAFEPENLPGWAGVCFRYAPPVEVAESSVQPDPAEPVHKYELPPDALLRRADRTHQAHAARDEPPVVGGQRDRGHAQGSADTHRGGLP